jgi:aldehyde dehydrogenase (NAD+)
MSKNILDKVSSTEKGFASIHRDDAEITAGFKVSLSLDMANIVSDLQATFKTGKTKSLAWRKQQLSQLLKMLQENHLAIAEAVGKDHQNSTKFRGVIDMINSVNGITQALANLDDWAADVPCKAPMFGDAFIRPEPKGVVLIISPWNYPLAMAIDPLIPILAAGNCAVIKPSEVSNHTSALLEQLIEKYMDRSAIRTVLGGIPETTALLEQKWNHIMYTGNGSVGRIVMAAAAKNLTPVTLELGGKSPTYVDKSANITKAATSLMFYKYGINVGQTCIAPDYVLVHEDVEDEFHAACRNVLNSYFGKDESQRKKHKGYARVINDRHTGRIGNLLKATNGQIVVGGEVDEANHYISPTIVKVPNAKEPLMREEIFGPVLPVLAVQNVHDAVVQTNQICDHPLALYVFAEDEAVIETYLQSTTSGGVAINTIMEHQQAKDMPFGGVGESGMGAYHGKYGFDEFSHQRSVFRRSTGRFGGGTQYQASPNSTTSDKFYNLAVKMMITGFLTDGQKNALKAVGGGVLAVLGARYFRARM